MKILHVIDSLDPKTGGPCQGLRITINELNNLEVSSEVVCLDSPDAQFIGQDLFPVNALGPTNGMWHRNANLVNWLKGNINRFDAIVINGLWLYHSYATWMVFKWLKQSGKRIPKLLVMPHGMLDPWFQKAKGRELKALRNWLYWKLLERRVINEADGLLFTGETELLLARKSFRPYYPKREMNVGYGIEDPPEFSLFMRECFLNICPSLVAQPYMLFLSRINIKKGVDILIKAYANLLAININLPKLVIAGPGLDSTYGKTIQKLVAGNTQLQSNVLFVGMLTGNLKWGALYGCEAFVLPSHQENFGIAVVEALACAKPVLISDQVNIWREINNGQGGIVENNSVDGTQRLVKKWLSMTAEEQQQMGKNAKLVFETHFSSKPAALRFLQALQSVVKAN